MVMSLDVDVILESKREVIEKISVIVPITERHDEIKELYLDYKEALTRLGASYEILFVVDGDFDSAYQELKTLKANGENFSIIKHSRKFGEATAITTGFKKSSGNVIMILPAYFQIEKSEFPKLVAALNGYDMVVVRRWPRSDSKWNQLQTKVFQRFVKSMIGSVSTDLGCSVRIFKREILDEIKLYGDLHRFLPILSERQGFKVKEIDLRQSTKEKKVRAYPLGVYIRRMIDLLTVFFLMKFMKKPLRFFGLTGATVLFIGILITSYMIFERFFDTTALSNRPLFLIGILFIVLGLQIFAIGLIGEIIIFTHAKDIKDYSIEEIIH